jgi:1-deoxy-D-xylulose-5-phosphate synthase
VGKWGSAAAEAAESLSADGLDVTVWDVRVVSDPDPAMLADAARHALVITAEDGIRQGGAGMFLADALRHSCPDGAAPPVVSLGIPRAYITQGKPTAILARLGLDGPGLARSVRESVSGRTGNMAVEAPDAQASSSLPATMAAKDVLD